MRDHVFILLSVLQMMQFNFTDITLLQKDNTRHTPSVKYLMTLIDIDVLFLSHWYYFFTVSTMCVKTILRERLLLFSINYYLSNWPLSSIIPNTEIRFIAWVKLKIACHDRKYARGRDEIKYVLFVYPAKIIFMMPI